MLTRHASLCIQASERGSALRRGLLARAWLSCAARRAVAGADGGSVTAAAGRELVPRSRRQHRHSTAPLSATSPQQAGSGAAGATGDGGGVAQAFGKLAAFCAAFPDVPDEVVGVLLKNTPSVITDPPAETASKAESLAAALGVDRLQALRLVAKQPLAWSRSADAVLQKLQPLAEALKLSGASVAPVVDLLVAQPHLWNIKTPSLVADKVTALADALGVKGAAEAIAMVAKQPLLWVVPPAQVVNTVGRVAEMLGLSSPESASTMVVRLPAILVVPAALVALSLSAAAARLGVAEGKLQQLVARSVGVVALPTDALCAGVEALSTTLGVDPDGIVDLLIQQPALLCANPQYVKSALGVLVAALDVTPRAALQLVVAQPALLYDMTRDTVEGQVEGVAAVFGVPAADVRALAAKQPGLLVIAPATLKSAVASYAAQLKKGPPELLQLLASDPGAFLMYGHTRGVLPAWTVELGLEEGAVGRLLTSQPALLEVTANSVKARLESLAALFDMPLQVVLQLVLKHPALGVIPPNATITRAKNLSIGLGLSMQGAAALMAKEPALLVAAPEALRGVVDKVQEVESMFEFHSSDWLQRQLKEWQPARSTSWAGMQAGRKPSNWY